MIRRWFIRGLALTLLALCVVAWVGSYWRGAYLMHDGRGWQQRAILARGGIGLGILRVSGPFHSQWLRGTMAIEPDFGWGLDKDDVFGWTGFHFVYRWADKTIVIPLWFPTLLSALLLWFVWRKTRAKQTGRAFPVQVPATILGESKP